MVEVESIRMQNHIFWAENQKGPRCNKRYRTKLDYGLYFSLKKSRMTAMVEV